MQLDRNSPDTLGMIVVTLVGICVVCFIVWLIALKWKAIMQWFRNMKGNRQQDESPQDSQVELERSLSSASTIVAPAKAHLPS